MAKILAVDDEKEICRILKVFLTKHGFEVKNAFNGEEALRLLGKEKFELVVLDINMPGLGGVKLLEKLKAEDIKTPVIVLTGSFNSPVPRDQFDFIKGFLYKPADLSELLNKIKTILKEG